MAGHCVETWSHDWVLRGSVWGDRDRLFPPVALPHPLPPMAAEQALLSHLPGLHQTPTGSLQTLIRLVSRTSDFKILPLILFLNNSY